MLAFIALGLTVIVILAGCVGMFYLFMRLTKKQSEPYFQFNEDNQG